MIANLLLAVLNAAFALIGVSPAIVALNWFVSGLCTAFAIVMYVERKA